MSLKLIITIIVLALDKHGTFDHVSVVGIEIKQPLLKTRLILD